MSTIRSLITGWLPIGSILTVPPSETCSFSLALHARTAWPFTRMAQEPQMDARQEQRRAREPSISSRTLIRVSRTVKWSSTST